MERAFNFCCHRVHILCLYYTNSFSSLSILKLLLISQPSERNWPTAPGLSQSLVQNQPSPLVLPALHFLPSLFCLHVSRQSETSSMPQITELNQGHFLCELLGECLFKHGEKPISHSSCTSAESPFQLCIDYHFPNHFLFEMYCQWNIWLFISSKVRSAVVHIFNSAVFESFVLCFYLDPAEGLFGPHVPSPILSCDKWLFILDFRIKSYIFFPLISHEIGLSRMWVS